MQPPLQVYSLFGSSEYYLKSIVRASEFELFFWSDRLSRNRCLLVEALLPIIRFALHKIGQTPGGLLGNICDNTSMGIRARAIVINLGG